MKDIAKSEGYSKEMIETNYTGGTRKKLTLLR